MTHADSNNPEDSAHESHPSSGSTDHHGTGAVYDQKTRPASGQRAEKTNSNSPADAPILNRERNDDTGEAQKKTRFARDRQDSSSSTKPAKHRWWFTPSWLTVIATAVIAFANISYVAYARQQLKIMSSTLEQMRTASGLVKAQISVMQSQLAEMRSSSESESLAWNNQLEIMAGQLAEMQSATHLEQRAWVGYKTGRPKPIEVNKPIECTVVYTNTGKTPGNDVRAWTRITIGPPNAPINEEPTLSTEPSSGRLGFQSNSTFPPNLTVSNTVTCETITSQSEFTDLVTGKVVAYICGVVKYKDIFGMEHVTRHCHVIDVTDPNRPKLIAYKQHNYMD